MTVPAGDARVGLSDRLQYVAARAASRLPGWVQRLLSGQRPVVVDGQTIDPQLQLIRRLHQLRGAPGLVQPDVPTARARFRRQMLALSGPKTAVGEVSELTIDGDAGPLRARHYAPPDDGERRQSLLVFLHGGGFAIGDLDTHDEPCRILCRHAGTHVLSVQYRLAPEHPFPAALEDARRALGAAREMVASGRIAADPARVAIGGDSAGANLATVVARACGREGWAPAAQLLIYPVTDSASVHRPSRELFGRGFFLKGSDRDSFARYYLEGTDVDGADPRVSPLRASDLAGMPPALVVTAGFDLLRDEGEAYAEALRAAGNVVRAYREPSLAHGFINLTGICPGARRATIAMARAWRALTST